MMRLRKLYCLVSILLTAGAANAATVTFDDLALSAESYWNGSDDSGGFTSGSVHFGNNYNADWASWDGFSYSNLTDTAMQGIAAQYNAITGAGQDGSANYANIENESTSKFFKQSLRKMGLFCLTLEDRKGIIILKGSEFVRNLDVSTFLSMRYCISRLGFSG